MKTATFLNRDEFLNHWQGHRKLTRRTIEKFPEEEFFTFSIGGMRTFGELVKELLTISVPGLEGIVNKDDKPFSHDIELADKAAALKMWDEQTEQINELYNKISDEELYETFNLFGQYKDQTNNNLMYFHDNEIHHRAQGFVYLRALGIEPPFFWER
ncbi:DinB family protein [Sphingobacterium kyonggiense]|uniref:DinB family protein n=1 Tax=Sphingobacterium kyonggiense TaxID=714075 RepID=A0ABP7YV38_9SPHI